MKIVYKNYGLFLEEHGIRASSQRILMLEYLMQNNVHPTADKIYVDLSKKLPTISKATVYNNLKLFLNKDIIKEVNIDNNEVHYDMMMDNHAHFICNKCNKIEDLDIKAVDIDTSILEGYDITSQDIFLKGTCSECLRKEKN